MEMVHGSAPRWGGTNETITLQMDNGFISLYSTHQSKKLTDTDVPETQVLKCELEPRHGDWLWSTGHGWVSPCPTTFLGSAGGLRPVKGESRKWDVLGRFSSSGAPQKLSFFLKEWPGCGIGSKERSSGWLVFVGSGGSFSPSSRKRR